MTRPAYTDEERAQAIAVAVEVGPAEAARRLDIHKGTIASWMSRAGVATTATEQTMAAVALVRATSEQRRAALVEQLLLIAEKAAWRELALLKDASLRDVVGARTRAIHDHQLLTGAATSRTESRTEEIHSLVEELIDRRVVA